MTLIPEIPIWGELLRKGVDDIVLNFLLLRYAADGSIELVKYLVSNGANANFCSSSTGPFDEWGWTTLAYSVYMGNFETVFFCLARARMFGMRWSTMAGSAQHPGLL